MGDVEIPSWLEGLPLAPVFRPTHTEFADPIAYISKIEKEASGFGICKIIPPLPKPSKRYVFSNLNKSLLKCPELGSDVNSLEGCSPMRTGSGDGGNDGEARAVFTTRHQELGQSVKKVKGAAVQNPPSGVDKQVWQSGEIYTLEQFETKSRAFARSMLGSIREVTPLGIEEMFWKAASEKPIYIEYANDVPGSAFEEPVGQFRSSHRRRRKRNSYQRRNENSDSKKGEMISISERNSHNEEVKNATRRNVSDTCLEASKSSTAPEILSADETPQSSRQKNPNSCCDMEGTAGWKLSNSPWNLQVIARSPGSLTRFMPDDIPGVTSPMVYIGMLFSWFAWHVEDHELHSMNFLHTGSSKTWYSVPGDYAFDFEELIRTEAFGSNLDRLAALSLLGNKTTLISPEAVVAAGIPCCRLIQNSGEFVVTFPRAYHVGFSHGFNCGEAANFGTPQWLKVAKEAAVRRAAMNYLPMLSHQQLLYLLTMSFVSRVPRSLLPGVRSSRRRDRQKEEKEFSVKKAFIEDIVKENNVLSVLLGKESSYHAVLWNHDLLPYTSKDSVTPGGGAAVDMNPKEDATHIQCGNYDNDQKVLIDEMSLYMENMNDLYLGSDDLSRDFQVDSGTLACVACGILGFPFMSVVQPSEKASMKLQTENFTAQGSPGISGLENSHLFPDCHASVMGFVTEEDLVSVPNFLPPAKDPLIPSADNLKKGWNTVNKFLRPRSFCLEHAVEIVDLLQCKGGANMLVICHSDYQKIKAPAAAIAEEIGCSFNYNEVSLDNASQEDLNLIELAVDDERDECGEDWTSKLGINLHYCVKVRKNSSLKQVQHALTLGGLFSKQSPSSDFLAVKWQSRRSRSKKLNHPVDYKPCENIEEKDEVVCGRSDGTSFKREEKIIQYSRRKLKLKAGSSTGVGRVCGHPATGVGGKDSRMASESNICNNGNSTSSCARFDSSASSGMSEMYPVVEMSEATRDISLYSTPSQVADTLTTATLIAGSVEAQVDNHSFEERNMNGEGCKFASRNISDVQDEMRILEEASQGKSATPPVIAADETVPMQIEEQQMEKISNTSEYCNLVSEGQSQVMAGVSVLAETTNLCAANSFVTSSEPQMVNTVLEKSCISNEVCDSMTSDDEVQQEIETTNRSKDKAPVPCSSHNAEDSNDDVSLVFELAEEIKTAKGENEEPSLSPRRQLIEPSLASVEGTSGAPRELCAAADFCPGPISRSEEFLTADRSGGEHVLTSVTQMEIIQPCISVEESSEVPRGGSSMEGTDDGAISDTVVQQEVQTTNEAIEAPILSLIIETEMQATPRLVEEFEVPRVTYETINISGSMGLDEGWKNRTTNGSEELIPSRDTSKCQPSPSIQTYSRAKRKPRAAPDLRNGGKVCLSLHDKEMENIGSSNVVAPSPEMGRKRKRELEQIIDDNLEFNGFIRGPCEGLRPRAGKDAMSTSGVDKIQEEVEEKPVTKKVKKPSDVPVPPKKEHARKSHRCDIESCRMRFATKAELMLHKRNRCPHEGCGKRFSSHKYAVSHSRVHDDDRPLKCPWKGCSMSFKWAWARTEHIRVHTGERPYQCKVEGCGLFFRFVSDYSRHRRKTGHYVS